MSINLWIHTIHLSHSNHSQCSDVPSELLLIVLQITCLALIHTTTPHLPMSEHLHPLPYHNQLCCHHLDTFPHRLQVSQHLGLSETPHCIAHSLQPFVCSFLLVTHQLFLDIITLLCLRYGKDIFPGPLFPRISFTELFHCFMPIYKHCWFPGYGFIPRPVYMILLLIMIPSSVLITQNLILFFTINFHRRWQIHLLSSASNGSG